ncbi:Peptidase family M50 [Rubripirellula amarantea]|uniref:Peptidase family M50 n=1 Tax=Rubripirellula amarantea TaxID=2527999 RepID=A0A5C5WTS5_9BACT|nr:site-2 protease family protein [Rubripirellula amarantea]TWT53423.1 Peptidase family M50 [Rubripirellula amarantea]
MLLQEPASTPYDLHFNCLGFRVRVSAWFWVAISLLGYSNVQSLDRHFGAASPGMLPMLLLWALCVLLSILIHELGHALAFRKYGMDASIVLYHFGGLAIPESRSSSSYDVESSFAQNQYGSSNRSLSNTQQIIISLAGPLLQLAVAVVVMIAVKLAGYGFQLSLDGFVYTIPLGPINLIPGLIDGAMLTSPGLYILLDFFLVPSVLWALLNLLPIWPLDGGQITSEVMDMRRVPKTMAFQLSMIVAGCVAAYGFYNESTYMGVMFLMLALMNYQVMQQFTRHRY